MTQLDASSEEKIENFTTPTSSSPTSSIQEIINNILKEEEQGELLLLSSVKLVESVGKKNTTTTDERRGGEESSTQWGEEEQHTYIPPPPPPSEHTPEDTPAEIEGYREQPRPPPPDALRVAPWKGRGLYRYKLYFEEASRALFSRFRPVAARERGRDPVVPTPQQQPPRPADLVIFRRYYPSAEQQPQPGRLRRLASSLAEKIRSRLGGGRFAR